MRVGFGYDIHPFREDESGQLRLGGIEIPDVPQLSGHSDGDSVIHAVIDALLGAAGEGDIGQHFPPGEPETAGIDSRELLTRVARLLSSRQISVVNVDVTVIAERPRLAEHLPAMRETVAGVLSLGADRVNVKATTNEGMGVIGNGQAIAAMAVALVEERVR
jgi:2-C-methyl-D-erythritol 2,4-cyclodiphosphate synthase